MRSLAEETRPPRGVGRKCARCSAHERAIPGLGPYRSLGCRERVLEKTLLAKDPPGHIATAHALRVAQLWEAVVKPGYKPLGEIAGGFGAARQASHDENRLVCVIGPVIEREIATRHAMWEHNPFRIAFGQNLFVSTLCWQS
jgi:hypothetical protein